jgi:hypothetical protein
MDLPGYQGNRLSFGERRSRPRIHVPFPAKIRGVDAEEKEFEVETALDNLSGNSLYLRMMKLVKKGTKLTVIFSLSLAAGNASVPQVKVNGTVTRVEQKPGGVSGVVVTFSRAQFL